MAGFGRRSEIKVKSRAAVSGDDAGDKRFAPRRNSRIPAMVYYHGSVDSIPCFVCDMSSTGARLELKSGYDNPFKADVSQMSDLRLVIRQDRVMFDCKIMRRGETDLGVKFTSAPRPILKASR